MRIPALYKTSSLALSRWITYIINQDRTTVCEGWSLTVGAHDSRYKFSLGTDDIPYLLVVTLPQFVLCSLAPHPHHQLVSVFPAEDTRLKHHTRVVTWLSCVLSLLKHRFA